jgi:DNA ligase-1
VERYAGGRVQIVRPEVVLEVAFDGLQKSPRHKSGYALRFPRIVRWRRDKRPEDIDTLARVHQISLGTVTPVESVITENPEENDAT